MFSQMPILRAEAVTPSEIEAAESEVGVRLSTDYKDFVARYGGAIVGPFRIFGLRRATPMGKNEGSFVEVTNAFRRQRWPGVEKWAVVSIDHSGNPIGLDREGAIWISDHDSAQEQPIAKDFEGYLRRSCLDLES